VGYGKPPRHTRFQKGRSGNPRGRPKGTPNIATALRRALQEWVTVNEGGTTRRMRKLDVAIRQQINKAAAGDAQAFKLLAQLLRETADKTDFRQSLALMVSPDFANF
jgi:hypothetical protein